MNEHAILKQIIACSKRLFPIYKTHHKKRFSQMKISARNVLEGTITAIKKGATTAHVSLDVNGTNVMASITNEAVDELKLTVGMKAAAVVKASDVIIAIDD